MTIPLPLAPSQDFTIRRNADGSIDVMCLNCLEIAGITCHEEDLLLIEEAHQCEPSVIVDAINHCWNC